MKNHVYKTLCMNCARAGGCTIPGDSDEPILSCDLYEILNDAGLIQPASAQPDHDRMDGLCVDCGNRSSCLYRQREGGTWHCEEYC